MKKKIHPDYQHVVFEDSSTGDRFVCGTTLQSEKSTTFEKKKYPLHVVSISSKSHPFFTGSGLNVDTEGRIKKFEKRYSR